MIESLLADPETPLVENHRTRKPPTCPELGRQVRGHGCRHDDQCSQRLFKVLTVLQHAGRGSLVEDTGQTDIMLLGILLTWKRLTDRVLVNPISREMAALNRKSSVKWLVT